MGTAPVRRSRRPATGSGAPINTINNNTTTTTTAQGKTNSFSNLPPGVVRFASSSSSAGAATDKAISSSSSSLATGTGPVDNGEIVVRDKNGGYKLDIPVLAPVVDQDGEGEEMEGVDGGGGGGGGGNEAEISGCEKQKIETSLMEMMCRNRRSRQMSNEPVEILNLIQQSLRNKVTALDEDNWMYEAE